MIIDLWPIGPDGSYALAGYQTGFSVMLDAQILCLVWFFIASAGKKVDRPHKEIGPSNY